MSIKYHQIFDSSSIFISPCFGCSSVRILSFQNSPLHDNNTGAVEFAVNYTRNSLFGKEIAMFIATVYWDLSKQKGLRYWLLFFIIICKNHWLYSKSFILAQLMLLSLHQAKLPQPSLKLSHTSFSFASFIATYIFSNYFCLIFVV